MGARILRENPPAIAYTPPVKPPSPPLPDTTPVSPEVIAMARQAVHDFRECFWWWNTDFIPETREDIREIVLNLRKTGGRPAWDRANALNACL